MGLIDPRGQGSPISTTSAQHVLIIRGTKVAELRKLTRNKRREPIPFAAPIRFSSATNNDADRLSPSLPTNVTGTRVANDLQSPTKIKSQ